MREPVSLETNVARTAGGAVARWRYFCHHNVGSGDMVYGLIRLSALRAAGTFRSVLRPDRLLMAELSLQGQIRQVPEVLWFRRQTGASVERQGSTLFLPGEQPPCFALPPWLQHSIVLREVYIDGTTPLPLSPGQVWRMIVRYNLTYGWKHFRKTETSHAIVRGYDHAIWARKITKHHILHAVHDGLIAARVLRGRAKRKARLARYHVAVAAHRTWGGALSVACAQGRRLRSIGRRAVYHALVLTHRVGLRGPRNRGAEE